MTYLALQVPHYHKTRLATCMLQDDAHQWRKSEMRTTFQVGEVHSIAWTEFVEAFKGHYFPELVYQQKQFEFINLTQGDLLFRNMHGCSYPLNILLRGYEQMRKHE